MKEITSETAVSIKLTEPGQYVLDVPPAYISLVAKGADGGNGASVPIGQDGELLRGSPGQATSISVFGEDGLLEDLSSPGGDGGHIAARGSQGETKGLTLALTTTVRLVVVVGNGGRGGIVTDPDETSLDGATGKHGMAQVFATKHTI